MRTKGKRKRRERESQEKREREEEICWGFLRTASKLPGRRWTKAVTRSNLNTGRIYSFSDSALLGSASWRRQRTGVITKAGKETGQFRL